jgi:L-rhamnose mutarotase
LRVWGDPVEYKGIKLHPVTMRDSMEFYDCVQCLLYEKNRVQDIQIIKMSYLDFLFGLIQQENSLYHKLEKVLSLTLGELSYEFYYEDNKIGLIINENKFNGYDFEEIKKIILGQNLIQHKEDFYDDDMEKYLREAEDFLSEKNGTPATLEERVVALHCLSGISYSEIKNYTIFQFTKTLERFSIIKNFDVYSALMAENGASKDIQHWLSHVEDKDRYADVIMSEADFNKIVADKDAFSTA